MITGIQITKAANDDLLNSFGCWTAKKAKHAASLRKQVSMLMKSLLSANWAKSNTVKYR